MSMFIDGPDPRFIIWDDDDDKRDRLNKALRQKGCQIEIVKNLNHALKVDKSVLDKLINNNGLVSTESLNLLRSFMKSSNDPHDTEDIIFSHRMKLKTSETNQDKESVNNESSTIFIDPKSNLPAVFKSNISADLLRSLQRNPDELLKLTPPQFEEFICDRLSNMGFDITRPGLHTYQKDGGVDVIAYPRNAKFPFLMAIQIKHHKLSLVKTGPSDVRDLIGTVHSLNFNAGALITNTTFAPEALSKADKMKHLIRLRDIDDIKRWLVDKYIHKFDLREMPHEIEVCRGVTVKIKTN